MVLLLLPLLIGVAVTVTSVQVWAQADPRVPAVALELVTDQLEQPVFVTHAGDGSGRLFIAEKRGRITVVSDGVPLPRPFLDINRKVISRGTEQGLLSVAFHPNYAANGLFYVGYTAEPGNVEIARYRVSPDDPNRADQASGVTLLHVEKPLTGDRPDGRHNGGLVRFGPDGYLYVGIGDGGIPLDPAGNAQNKSVLLGKLLRLDVDNGEPYAIPPDNPFVDEPGSRAEIWAYGLRNPWSFSFDRATGDLYIADVGDYTWEEINLQRAGTSGQNYGWNQLEGRHCARGNAGCDLAAYEPPIAEYRHRDTASCAVVGGHVYRGPSYPQLKGIYFFGDFCSGRVLSLQEQTQSEWLLHELADTDLYLTSVGEDEAGDTYLTSLRPPGLHRLVLPR